MLKSPSEPRTQTNKPTGRVDCFKAVGTFFGDPEACKKELTLHLRKKLAPLDVIDTIVDTDCVTNTSQLRLNLIQRGDVRLKGTPPFEDNAFMYS